MPELKDMTYSEIVDACTWEITQQLFNGKLRSGVASAMALYAAWLKERPKSA